MDKASRMYALVERQASSGQSIKDFCITEGISYATFHYWRRKSLSHREATPHSEGFISLRCLTSSESAVADLNLEVRLPGGLHLSFGQSDLERVADLLVRLDRRYAEL
jgi:hypothetical protein